MKNIPLIILLVASSYISAQSSNSVTTLKTNSDISTLLNTEINKRENKNKTKKTSSIKNTIFINEKVQPNPAKDYVSIKTLPNSRIHIYNTAGNIIKEFNNVFGESIVDIRDLNEGIYYVSITEPDSEVLTQKLYVQ